jgi:hypothetical protein
MTPGRYAEQYPGIWNGEAEVFRVLAFPDGSGWVDIEFINQNRIKLGTIKKIPGIYTDAWLYDRFEVALSAAYTWAARQFQGEPYGWIQHPSTGRRRHNGNHETEYSQP